MWRTAALFTVSLLLCVGTGCGSDSSTPHVAPSSTVASTTVAPTVAYALPGGGFTIAALPNVFSRFGDFRRQMTGPVPGETLDRQGFLNRAANQRINVSVVRGFPAEQVLDTAQYVESARRVNGCVTRTRDTPTAERQLGWIAGPTTVAFVTGSHVTDDLLFSVADATVIER